MGCNIIALVNTVVSNHKKADILVTPRAITSSACSTSPMDNGRYDERQRNQRRHNL